jgi:hypothetical protein
LGVVADDLAESSCARPVLSTTKISRGRFVGERLKEALQNAIAIVPASFQRSVRERAPWTRPEYHPHMLEGLRKAGWRET